MPIEINGLTTGLAANRQRSDAAKAADGSAPHSDKSSGSSAKNADTVQLSAEGKNLQRLEEQASSLPDVDSERVAELKQAIGDGSYQPNAENIAAKMLKFDEML